MTWEGYMKTSTAIGCALFMAAFVYIGSHPFICGTYMMWFVNRMLE